MTAFAKYPKMMLLILDGWGIGADPAADAIRAADTPFMDSLCMRYPNSTLTTHGYAVGLPKGQMGNSEVGHLNLGAGRVVYQELARINKAIDDNELAKNDTLRRLIAYAKEYQKPIHLLGLVSDGGVHSHINHLKALIDIIEAEGVAHCFVHAFTDGRDTDPKSGTAFIGDLQHFLAHKRTQIASLVGRYYAMDRDKRWERVRVAYDLLVHGTGEPTTDFASALHNSYAEGITDEFAAPMYNAAANGTIKNGDAVLFFNFRTDRPRELTEVLTQNPIPEQAMQPLDLYYATMTRYDEKYKNIHILFEKDDIAQTIGEVLAAAHKTQIRIAETEKYPHVTFFFNGGREEPFVGESRIMLSSPKVATYDLQPEMSAQGITDAIMTALVAQKPDFVCLNYANTDMVGHTGVWAAAKIAAQTVDNCLAQLVPTALAEGYALLIIADHGNSDFLINADGTPNTAHTLNPVPCILVANDTQNMHLADGKLADIAPTMLYLMGVISPAEMTGNLLVEA